MKGASAILPGLWQGAAPPEGPALFNEGFRVLVLAAVEHQRVPTAFPGLRVINCPLDDDVIEGLTEPEWEAVRIVSKQLARYVASGTPALVTCYMGKNRSGIIVAATVARLTGCSGAAAVEIVKMARPQALANPRFVEMLSNRIRGVRKQTVIQRARLPR